MSAPQNHAGISRNSLMSAPANGSKTVAGVLRLMALVVAVCLVYGPAMQAPFIFDDKATIIENRSIRHLWPLAGGGEDGSPLSPQQGLPVSARPVVNLSFALNYHFGGINPFGYRVVHVVVHLFSALLLWRIVGRTLRLEHFQGRFASVAEPLSFAVALVWALHPAATETLVYVTQRTELAMGFFYLATLYCSIRFWDAPQATARSAWLVLATLGCSAGMLSKEVMVSAPVMVLLYQRIFRTGTFRRAVRQSWPLYCCLALTWIPLLIIQFRGSVTPGAGFDRGATGWEWWFTQAKVIFLYLKLTVWPWPLVIHYEIPLFRSVADAWPWLLAAGLLGIGTLVLCWRNSAVGFVGAWFFAVLSPTLVIPLVGETAAERRMYLPLAAVVSLILVGSYSLLERLWRPAAKDTNKLRRGRALAAFSLAMLVLAIGFGMLSRHRLRAYRDEHSIWQDALVHQPHDPLVHTNLAISLVDIGRRSDAIGHFEQAVQLDPDSYLAHYNLARALEESGRPRDAIEHYRDSIRLKPDDAAAHYNLARLLEGAGADKSAAEHYRQAIAANQDFSAAHTNLGILLLIAGDTENAIHHLETALRLQADLDNHLNLVVAYANANRFAAAIPVAEQALVLARVQGDTLLVATIERELAALRARSAKPDTPR